MDGLHGSAGRHLKQTHSQVFAIVWDCLLGIQLDPLNMGSSRDRVWVKDEFFALGCSMVNHW